eukprot:m.62187 g.62187  ORF g.62187 m.62187 type:complete len:116 (+) comp8020_c0_seq1:2204-2551(+)
MDRFQFMNLCKPPTFSIISGPGRVPRWYVFDNMIWHPISSNCFGVTPFIVPCVPTGMNIGVSIVLWGRRRVDALARDVQHLANTSNSKALVIVMVVRNQLQLTPLPILNCKKGFG